MANHPSALEVLRNLVAALDQPFRYPGEIEAALKPARALLVAVVAPAAAPSLWERRQGMRMRGGWHWSDWRPCTEVEAQRVTGLQSWQVRQTGECAACGGTGRVACGAGR